ncbi:MAG TPA: N-acetyl-D-Glu racemase DgcA [Steroidobacteraceae bacterium]|nr:N-acetyl-D-Glu racemase DgcA [Steroidobacteraceae bacterium]
MQLTVDTESLPLSTPFRISGRVFNAVDTLVATVTEDDYRGRGEAQGVYHLGETTSHMREQLVALAAEVSRGLTREALQRVLPAGGARNALDCALWDLEAKKTGRRAWDLAGLRPRPLLTACTVSLAATAGEMAEQAAQLHAWPIIKLKLDADDPVGRVAAAHARRPDAQLLVDANQAWTLEQLRDVVPHLRALGVRLIEQPLPRGQDVALADYHCPVPLCADESCLDSSELAWTAARYQMVNIKLDKAGGLTEALQMARKARDLGLNIMVGNMGGSSLSMAPSFVVGLLADVIDLDGPVDLARDRAHGLRYKQGVIAPPSATLWG